ncbi:hypothetical protein SAY86_002747 [Trapa natans]|uniref:Uncharacterized protein n=1 Tax=Trapa natans TaxID=22666 RepID=A0AAN7LDU1_TRANT|nr:hypothetical protein SAY86_002747 [Trapa natans]
MTKITMKYGNIISMCLKMTKAHLLSVKRSHIQYIHLKEVCLQLIVLASLTVNVDPILQDVIQEFGVLGLYDTYVEIHKPKNIYEADLARKRFIFDEFFYLQLGQLLQMLESLVTETEKNGLLDKFGKPELSSMYTDDWSSLTKLFLAILPYSLTPSQLTAASEKIWDLKRAVPMNRILQGLADGEISMVIGTHSLIADSVEFSSLRITVVDEKHLFGVIQRGRFNSKLGYASMSPSYAKFQNGNKLKTGAHIAPHVLAVSATPIPRTLALALYGDVSLTHITELRLGRIPVDTHVIEGVDLGLEQMYRMILDELESGGKVYLVYPIIEQSEHLPQLHAAASVLGSMWKRFSDYSCGLLHGKMKSDEKEEVMRHSDLERLRFLLQEATLIWYNTQTCLYFL